MNNYGQIITKLQDTPWLITEGGLRTILQVVESHLQGNISLEEIRQRTDNGKRERGSIPSKQGSVGVLPLHGPIFPRANLMTELSGATSVEQWAQDFRALLQDDRVDSVLLDVDSPGGSAAMIEEMANEIFAARDIKPVYAVANGMAASAAYYLASQASEVYASDSAVMGSIGTYMVHTDASELKAKAGVTETVIKEGRFKAALIEPLSSETHAHLQGMVTEFNNQFLNAVARGRNTSVEDVVTNYGEGGILSAKQALAVGMVDGIRTYDEVLGALLDGGGTVQEVRSNGGGSGFSLRASLDKELEHSEPGTGSPPQPRIDPEDEHKDEWKKGERLQRPPNIPELEENMNREQLLAYASQLGIRNADKLDDEALSQKVAEELTSTMELVGELQNATQLAAEQVEFAQKYPEQAERLARLEARDQEHEATNFANSLASFTVSSTQGEGEEAKTIETPYRLSVRAQDVVKDAHLSLSKGELNHDVLKQLVEVVAASGVQQGEVGSSRQNESAEFEAGEDTVPRSIPELRKAYAGKVADLMKQDNMTRDAAMEEAAKRFPELAAAYKQATK